MGKKRQGSNAERELKKVLGEYGIIVIRSAGSLAVDIVGIIPSIHSIHTPQVMLFEVKSTNKKAVYFNGEHGTKEQLNELYQMVSEGILTSIAVKWRGRGRNWEIFPLGFPLGNKEGKKGIFKEGTGKTIGEYMKFFDCYKF